MTRIPRRRLLLIALVCFLLTLAVLSFVGCSDLDTGTSPTSVVRFAWAPPPSGTCHPTLPIPEQVGLPIGGVRPLWIWQKDGKTYTYTMQREHGFYFVCDWKVQ